MLLEEAVKHSSLLIRERRLCPDGRLFTELAGNEVRQVGHTADAKRLRVVVAKASTEEGDQVWAHTAPS